MHVAHAREASVRGEGAVVVVHGAEVEGACAAVEQRRRLVGLVGQQRVHIGQQLQLEVLVELLRLSLGQLQVRPPRRLGSVPLLNTRRHVLVMGLVVAPHRPPS